jgi:hypothetical protein
VDYLISFLIGVFCGTGIFLGYGIYHISKIRASQDGLVTQIKNKSKEMISKRDAIKDRLIKASEIAHSQAAMRAQIEMPSKNALHSKYKNDLIGEILQLEQEKLDILRTVLAEGYDPIITTITETGKREEMTLSAYVNLASSSLGSFKGGNDINVPKKTAKFTILKGGKDDGQVN